MATKNHNTTREDGTDPAAYEDAVRNAQQAPVARTDGTVTDDSALLQSPARTVVIREDGEGHFSYDQAQSSGAAPGPGPGPGRIDEGLSDMLGVPVRIVPRTITQDGTARNWRNG